MSWLSRFMLANWSYVIDAVLLVAALLFGAYLGESRIQKAWDSEKQHLAQVEAKQEQHVADVRQSQSQITQEITNEFAKRSKLLVNRQPDARVDGVRINSSTGGRNLPAVSETADRAAASSADSLPASQGNAITVNCSQLASDAAQTTLMLIEIQRWYERQSKNFQ